MRGLYYLSYFRQIHRISQSLAFFFKCKNSQCQLKILKALRVVQIEVGKNCDGKKIGKLRDIMSLADTLYTIPCWLPWVCNVACGW